MAPTQTWDTAFFRQAQSNFAVFDLLQQADEVPLCHRLHYLQMGAEKVAKAYLSRHHRAAPNRTHDALVDFLLWASLNSGFRQAFGATNPGASFTRYVRSMLSVAERVQALSPEGDDHPNPEYPWLNPRHEIESPLDYPFVDLNPDLNREVLRLVEFLRACVEIDF